MYTIKEFTGHHHVYPNSQPDIRIQVDLGYTASEKGLLILSSIHGQENKVVKSISLSLEDVTALRDLLSGVLDNLPDVYDVTYINKLYLHRREHLRKLHPERK